MENQELRTQLDLKLTPFVQQVLDSFELAGMAVGVVQAGELVYAHGFGVRSLATQTPVTPRSLFHMASISKPFVATAVLQLVEQGRIDLEAPAVTYLPSFRLRDERSGAITIRQLLSHTAGMPDETDYRWYAPEDDDGALERYVRSLADRQLIAAPGERYAYSNIAFEILGAVIAKVSGQSFEGYLKSHVLDPLGMRYSTFLRSEVPPELAVTPHGGAPLQVLGGSYPYHRAHAPSSTLHSNLEELSRWAIANLHRGTLDDRCVLQPESYDLLWRRYAETGEEGWEEAAGLGWFFGTYQGLPVLHHGGSDPGFGCELILLPEQDAAVVVLANANTSAIGSVADAALDLLLGGEPQLPQPPITVPVGAALAADGPEAAAALYRRILADEPERYNMRPWRFMDAVWGAIELRRVEAVMPLVQLWAALQPDEALAHEALGWAQMVIGDRAAAHSLRRAVELDPEASHARALLDMLGV